MGAETLMTNTSRQRVGQEPCSRQLSGVYNSLPASQLHRETGAHAPGYRFVLALIQQTKPPVMIRRWKSKYHLQATLELHVQHWAPPAPHPPLTSPQE